LIFVWQLDAQARCDQILNRREKQATVVAEVLAAAICTGDQPYCLRSSLRGLIKMARMVRCGMPIDVNWVDC
jgi:hypothetical protein